MSFYEILEVSSTATPLEIKRAYRRLVLIHHPDKGGNPDRFKRIQTAYEVLKDDKRRRAYDRNGENEEKAADLFQNLFGQSGIFNLFNRLRKPPLAIYRKEVTLEELCRRLTLSLKVTRDRICKCQKSPELYRECGECRNGIVDDTKIFSIHLTPLTCNGYRYKFVGEGNEERNEFGRNEIGDFIVEIRHSPHPMFTLKDGHLIFHRKTTLHESLCGYTSIVLHPSGENIVLSFKAVIKPEEQRTIKGKGMTDEHDLIVVHTIIFPDTLTEEQTRRIDNVFKLKE